MGEKSIGRDRCEYYNEASFAKERERSGPGLLLTYGFNALQTRRQLESLDFFILDLEPASDQLDHIEVLWPGDVSWISKDDEFLGSWAMTPRVLCFVGLIGILPLMPASAACTGSGLAFSCPAGSSSSDLSNALSSASDGAVITFASGSYSWSSFINFDNSKGATLICASAGACTVSASGTVLGMNGSLSGQNTHFYRISGFVLNESSATFTLWFYGAGTMTQLRIDHNTFTGPAGYVAIFLGENSTVANFYGVIDHNTMTSSGSSALLNIIGALNTSPPAAPLGTGNNMFVEDNTITMTTMTDSGEGCVDSWGGAQIVWRHNTSMNCLVTTHGATHAGGPQNFELYGNLLQVKQWVGGGGSC